MEKRQKEKTKIVINTKKRFPISNSLKISDIMFLT